MGRNTLRLGTTVTHDSSAYAVCATRAKYSHAVGFSMADTADGNGN